MYGCSLFERNGEWANKERNKISNKKFCVFVFEALLVEFKHIVVVFYEKKILAPAILYLLLFRA